MLLAQFNYSWMFFECAFGLSLTNFSILWNRVLHPTMCVDSPLHQTNPRRAVSALTQEHTANTFPLQNWAACTPRSKNIQLRSSVMLCLFFFFFFWRKSATVFFFFFFWTTALLHVLCSNANPRVRQLGSLCLLAFYTCHPLQPRVCPASEIPLLGMFVWNQNVCQTAASSHLSVGGWWVWLPSVAPLMRHGGCVWSMLGRGVGGPGTLSMWICPFPCFGCLECVARDCWPACFYPFPAQQQQQRPSVHWSLWSCMALWYLWVFFFLFSQKPSIRHTPLVRLFSRFTSASVGPFISIWPRRSAVFYAASCRFQFGAATYHGKPLRSAPPSCLSWCDW